MAEIVTVSSQGSSFDFYNFIGTADFARQVSVVRSYFDRMPAQHVAAVYPVFLIVRAKPSHGPGGGTWRPSEVDRFLGRETVTGAPDADIQPLIARGVGVHAVPAGEWGSTPASTSLHEAAHAVDYRLNLVPEGATAADFRGVRPVCGGSSAVARYAVEAYARMVVTPGQICRDDTGSESRGDRDRAVRRLMLTAPAFRGVPRFGAFR